MKNNNQGRKSQVGRGTGAGALLHGRRGAATVAQGRCVSDFVTDHCFSSDFFGGF